MSARLQVTVTVQRPGFGLDVDLALPRGVTAVLGPNGSGKTTLLKTVAGLVGPTRGSVRLLGPDRSWADTATGTALPPERRSVGMVLAEPVLFPHLDLLDNVAFGPRSRGAGSRASRARAARELDSVGLTPLAGRRPGAVSSGQAQRAALARALATDPEVLLLDEPLSALDPATRSLTRADLAHRLAAYEGVCLLVTHDPLDALTLADHLVFLEEGRVVEQGSPGQVVHAPRSPYAARMVGLNLLRGRVRVGTAVTVDVDGQEVVTAEEPAEVTDGAPVWVALPPGAVALHPQRPSGSPRNVWPVTVTGVTLAGQRARVDLDGPVPLTAEVTVAALTGLRIARGARLWAAVKATELTVYPA